MQFAVLCTTLWSIDASKQGKQECCHTQTPTNRLTLAKASEQQREEETTKWAPGCQVPIDSAKAESDETRQGAVSRWTKKVIEPRDAEKTKKAIALSRCDDGRYDPATAGTRRLSPTNGSVTRLGGTSMKLMVTKLGTDTVMPQRRENKQEKNCTSSQGGTLGPYDPKKSSGLERSATNSTKTTAKTLFDGPGAGKSRGQQKKERNKSEATKGSVEEADHCKKCTQPTRAS